MTTTRFKYPAGTALLAVSSILRQMLRDAEARPAYLPGASVTLCDRPFASCRAVSASARLLGAGTVADIGERDDHGIAHSCHSVPLADGRLIICGQRRVGDPSAHNTAD
jgi:hypothetical protein